MHNYEFFVTENVNRNAVFLQAHLKVIETKVKHSVRSVAGAVRLLLTPDR